MAKRRILWLALPSVSCNALLHTVLIIRVPTRTFSNTLSFKMNAIGAPVGSYSGQSQS